jgi:hypothetical protein
MSVIIIPTYAQINSVKLILKLLHVSVLIHHLQGVYKLCQLKLCITKMIKYNTVACHYGNLGKYGCIFYFKLVHPCCVHTV